MTPVERELEQQRRWRLLPKFVNYRKFDALLENEFRSPDDHRMQQDAALRNMIGFALEECSFYRRVCERRGLKERDFQSLEDLSKLPVLSKHDVLESKEELKARTLPPGDEVGSVSKSSGTTGRPVSVLHSRHSMWMSNLLKQRHARWAGLDPMATRLDVRASFDVAGVRGAGRNPGGSVVDYGGWRHLKEYFHTGKEYGFNVSDKMDTQIAAVRRLRPAYVQSYPGTFEEWLLANDGKSPCDSIQALLGLGSQLTESMSRRIVEGFGVPIQMSYGLNEIGKVAVRCAAGRYHVHIEHCVVEIVGDDGRPCAPGEIGHVLVTGLRNHAMPLFRYDTGDLAEAVSGPCPCGRTLPQFGEIAGRYRRYAGLPPLSRERVRAIRDAIEETPSAGLGFLRRYQIHQDRENRFTVRLKTVAPVPDDFRRKLLAAWAPVAEEPAMQLNIVEVDAIATSPSGKLLDFMSDFHTDSATAPIPWVREAQ